ncbi:hypothetical protein BJ322DRAFT_1110315 [Thelephora terrestris]|uniref:Uncharacterized protein n=1 Tax=Thelephora terrestris TaxID=56493 RepID=A0A9P6HCX8_9AGAM|nr:hypothetical protein BJ322DRAFT_1110315 [Thelephora terrestris]
MPFSAQEITLLQAKLKEEFDSGPLWVNGALSSILSEGTLHQVEGDTTVDGHLDPLLPSFNDAEDVDFVVSVVDVLHDIHPEDLFGPASCQTANNEFLASTIQPEDLSGPAYQTAKNEFLAGAIQPADLPGLRYMSQFVNVGLFGCAFQPGDHSDPTCQFPNNELLPCTIQARDNFRSVDLSMYNRLSASFLQPEDCFVPTYQSDDELLAENIQAGDCFDFLDQSTYDELSIPGIQPGGMYASSPEASE